MPDAIALSMPQPAGRAAPTEQQRRSAMVVVGIVAVLGVVLLIAGFHFRSSASAGAQVVTPQGALDRQRVPVDSFVTIQGTPAAMAETMGDDRAVIFALREQPALVLVCPGTDATCQRDALTGSHAFTGRVYNGGDYAGPYGLPMLALDQFAKQQHLDNATLRVVSLGEKPSGDASSAVVAFVFGGLLLALSAVLGVLVKKGVLPKAPRGAAT